MAATHADLKMTDLALERVKALRATEGHPDDWGLRLAVEGGGCSGFKYDIGFCAAGGQPGDRVAAFDGMNLYVERMSYLFLIGLQLDWEETFMKTGFVFKNPNVTAACGCGESVAF